MLSAHFRVFCSGCRDYVYTCACADPMVERETFFLDACALCRQPKEALTRLERRFIHATVARIALYARLHRLERPHSANDDMRRASGEALCGVCGLPYLDHPSLLPTVEVECTGEIVKT